MSVSSLLELGFAVFFHPPAGMRIADSTPCHYAFPEGLPPGGPHLAELLGIYHQLLLLLPRRLVVELGQRQVVLRFGPARPKDRMQDVDHFLAGRRRHEKGPKGKGGQDREQRGVGIEFHLRKTELVRPLGPRVQDDAGAQAHACQQRNENTKAMAGKTGEKNNYLGEWKLAVKFMPDHPQNPKQLGCKFCFQYRSLAYHLL